MSDWKEYYLGDVTEWSSGGTPSKKNDDFWGGDISWITASSMNGNRYRDSKLKITNKGLKAGSRLAEKGSVLLLVRGSILHQKVLVGITEQDVAFNQDVKAIKPKEEFLDSWYLLFWFMSIEKDLLNMVENTGIGAGKLDTKLLQKLTIKIPSKEKRDRIKSYVKTIDDKLVLNSLINQTLEQIAQAIFKSWFIDFDPVKAKGTAKQTGTDPEIAAICAMSGKTQEQLKDLDKATLKQLKTTAALFPDKLVESELGEIPGGWSAKPLYETAEYINGRSFKTNEFSSNGEGLPIVKIVELKNGLSEGTKYTTGQFKTKYFIQNNDVLYSWSGSPETSLEVFKWFGGDGWLNQHIFKLNFVSSDQKYFTYYLLKHMKPLLISTAKQKQTTGLGHITVADMKRLLVAYPDNQLLTQFKKMVGSMYESCSILDQENISLANIRNALLPKLLNGDIELETDI